MIYNRLRDLRKVDLGISSIEKLAELLGGDESGWYHQKIQRIETGQTKLTDEDAHYIAAQLKIPIYTLFVEPITTFDDKDKELVSRYHAAKPEVQQAIDILLKRDG